MNLSIAFSQGGLFNCDNLDENRFTQTLRESGLCGGLDDGTKPETPISGCESYTGSQYDECIDSQLDDTLKKFKDRCGEPTDPDYVRCILGDEKKNRTNLPPETHQIPCDPTKDPCAYKNVNPEDDKYRPVETANKLSRFDKALEWVWNFGEKYAREYPYKTGAGQILKPLVGGTIGGVITGVFTPNDLGYSGLESICRHSPNYPPCNPQVWKFDPETNTFVPRYPPAVDYKCDWNKATCDVSPLPPWQSTK